MSGRELVVLGTASQAPTRTRNHNGYLLRWDTEGVLFDPGEGTQRQMSRAGVSASAITRICITHFHGDHCLGLPGVIQRLSLDQVSHTVPVHYPDSGQVYFDRLRHASLFMDHGRIEGRPAGPGVVDEGPPLRLLARHLDHRVETLGWRLEEPDGRRMLPERLAAAGVRGADIGHLQRDGEVTVAGRRVRLEDVSEHRRGQAVAFIMDTAICDAAFELAAGADLVICESTYLSVDADLADAHRHLTAAQAATIAARAGARRLVLTHFSERYGDLSAFGEEAGAIFDDVVVATDLARIPVPPRADPPGS